MRCYKGLLDRKIGVQALNLILPNPWHKFMFRSNANFTYVCMLASRARLWRPNSRGGSCCFGKLGRNFSGNALPRVHSHSLGQEDTRTASVEDGLQKQARLQGCSTFWQCKPCLLVGEPQSKTTNCKVKFHVRESHWLQTHTLLQPPRSGIYQVFHKANCLKAEIFMGILAKRTVRYLQSSGYVDESVQKAGVPGIPGCIKHAAMILNAIQDGKKKTQRKPECSLV